MAPLVILYSTAYRQWEKALPTQLELFNKITDDPMFGIHYWTTVPWLQQMGYYAIAPSQPPEAIRKWPYKHTMTEQTKEFYETIARVVGYKKLVLPVAYFLFSTKIALENAESLWRERYGTDMPDDQPILRLRPDLKFETTDNFPEVPTTNNYYISNWNRLHRPNWNPNAPEVGDVMCLTTKKVVKDLVNFNPENLEALTEKYRSMGREVWFSEQYLWTILEENGVNVVQDENIHLSIETCDGGLNKLC